MTVKEFYDAAGGGYEGMKAKFSSDDTITTFLKIFKRDTSYITLKEMLELNDVEGAFGASHTFKGVVLNLNLEGISGIAVDLCELLRAGKLEEAKELFPQVEKAYNKVAKALDKILQ